jgi:hypothetical protein
VLDEQTANLSGRGGAAPAQEQMGMSAWFFKTIGQLYARLPVGCAP